LEERLVVAAFGMLAVLWSEKDSIDRQPSRRQLMSPCDDEGKVSKEKQMGGLGCSDTVRVATV
jgi:hypothetical protein